MKLYTGRGDAGQTDLFGGQRVTKDQLRVEAYGTVDELNATLGLAAVTAGSPSDPNGASDSTGLAAILAWLQHRLFDLGADLATPLDSPGADKVRRIGSDDIAAVEQHIDTVDGGLPALRAFILPGGTELAARLHLARTVCRRAERRVVALAKDESLDEHAVVFLNRVSDLLFAMARAANAAAGADDVEWRVC